MLNISYLCTRLTHIGVQWCNGSTTGFGSVCGGSNPPLWWFESALDNVYGKKSGAIHSFFINNDYLCSIINY